MTRVIIIVRGGCVQAACSNDPTLDVAVLDYDNWKQDAEHDSNYQALSDEADQLIGVY